MKALEYSSVSQSETLHATIGANVSPRRFKLCFLVSLVSVVLLVVILYSVPSYRSSHEDPVVGSSDSAGPSSVPTKSPEEDSGSGSFTPGSVHSGVTVATKQDIPATEYNCLGDRFAHEAPLRSGQFLCSNNKHFVFGMTAEGSLIKRSVTSDTTYKKNDTFYDTGEGGDYFVLHRDGQLAVYDKNDKVKWEHESRATIHWTAECLTKPKYDCPYLHLHDDGVLVLNWIGSDGRWIAKGIKEAYDFSGK